MLKNVRRMAGLIDDTLDFVRGRLGGGLSLNLQWSEGVGAAIDEVVEEAWIAHPLRQIRSSVGIDRAIRCDLCRLQQIASNLEGNAIAHESADGDIEIRAGCDAESLELTVWNQGEPITLASMAKIFDSFWRQASGRDRDGLGLELHICPEIAKAHAGSLTVFFLGPGTNRICRAASDHGAD